MRWLRVCMFVHFIWMNDDGMRNASRRQMHSQSKEWLIRNIHCVKRHCWFAFNFRFRHVWRTNVTRYSFIHAFIGFFFFIRFRVDTAHAHHCNHATQTKNSAKHSNKNRKHVLTLSIEFGVVAVTCCCCYYVVLCTFSLFRRNRCCYCCCLCWCCCIFVFLCNFHNDIACGGRNKSYRRQYDSKS